MDHEDGGGWFSFAAQVKRVPQIVDVQQENGVLQVSVRNALQVEVVGLHKIISRKAGPLITSAQVGLRDLP